MARIAFLGALLTCLVAGQASAITLFADDFNRPDSNQVGNGWSEYEDDSDDVAIVDNHLQLRDNQFGIDAAIFQTSSSVIDTTGFANLVLSYDWAATENTESSDKLLVQYKVDGDWFWTPLTSHELGGSDFANEEISLDQRAENAKIRLRFYTNVSGSTEAALLDNIELSAREARADRAHMPEPTGAALFGIGLFAVTRALRRR